MAKDTKEVLVQYDVPDRDFPGDWSVRIVVGDDVLSSRGLTERESSSMGLRVAQVLGLPLRTTRG